MFLDLKKNKAVVAHGQSGPGREGDGRPRGQGVDRGDHAFTREAMREVMRRREGGVGSVVHLLVELLACELDGQVGGRHPQRVVRDAWGPSTKKCNGIVFSI